MSASGRAPSREILEFRFARAGRVLAKLRGPGALAHRSRSSEHGAERRRPGFRSCFFVRVVVSPFFATSDLK
eukprot:2769170-Pyramimonas_sp.AAC.1